MIVRVKIAEYAVLQEQGVLITYGLGSCMGVALYDTCSKVAGMAHILLNDSSRFVKPGENSFNPAKFADTALPAMLESMFSLGATQKGIGARIAGGASLFQFQGSIGSMGEKNIEAVRMKLRELLIPICGEDVGGNYGRTMKLLVDTGEIFVTTARHGEKKI